MMQAYPYEYGDEDPQPTTPQRGGSAKNTLSLKRYWLRRRRRYQRLHGGGGGGGTSFEAAATAAVSNRPSSKKNMQSAWFGGDRNGERRRRRFWRLKPNIVKLRFMGRYVASPVKIWRKFKDGYVNMMLRLAGNNTGSLDFGRKRIPNKAAKNVPMVCSGEEFENRLVFEIYKALVASRELEN